MQVEAYEGLFRKLESDYRFVVTGFTRFELLRSSDRQHKESVITYLQQEMINVDLSTVLMDFSARLHYLYGKHISTKSRKISDGDIINASTAIIKRCPLITMDNLDYPIPFFQEIDRQRVEYTSAKGRPVIDTLYVLAPDMQNIQYCFENHAA